MRRKANLLKNRIVVKTRNMNIIKKKMNLISKSILTVVMMLMAFALRSQTIPDGIKAWENQNYNTARDIFKKVTETDPSNGKAYYYYGKALFKTGDIAGAKMAFDKGVSVAPGEYLNYVGQAKCLLEDGNTSEAEKKIKLVMSATRGKDPATLSAIADAYATNKNKDYTKALEYAQRAVETSKGSTDYHAYNELADIYFEKHYSGNGDDKDAGNAVTNYEKSYQINPMTAYAITRVGEIWSSTRNEQSYKLAMDALDKAKAADPDFIPLHGVLAYLYQKSGQFEKAKTEQEIYMKGTEDKIKPNDRMINILYKLKDWQATIAIAQKMNKMFPENCDYIRVLAHSYTESEKESEAMMYFNKLLTKCNKNNLDIDDYTYLAKANKLAGNDSVAVQYYYQVIGMDSTKEQDMLKEIANTYYMGSNYLKAAEVYKVLMEKYPTPNSQYRLMDSYYSAKKYKEQKEAADTFIARNPNLALGYLYGARALYFLDTLNDRKSSVDMYKVYLEKAADTVNQKVYKSELVEAHKQLLQYHILKNDLNAALEDCKNALKIDPENEYLASLKKRIEVALKDRNAPMKPRNPSGNTLTPKK
jgi:tetratricopeptide (TPR) repeat protein